MARRGLFVCPQCPAGSLPEPGNQRGYKARFRPGLSFGSCQNAPTSSSLDRPSAGQNLPIGLRLPGFTGGTAAFWPRFRSMRKASGAAARVSGEAAASGRRHSQAMAATVQVQASPGTVPTGPVPPPRYGPAAEQDWPAPQAGQAVASRLTWLPSRGHCPLQNAVLALAAARLGSAEPLASTGLPTQFFCGCCRW